jgi:transcriptional regulator with XRE-family HTH domain
VLAQTTYRRVGSRQHQEELADQEGLSARYLGSIERAAVSASVTVLGRLAQPLRVDACEKTAALSDCATHSPLDINRLQRPLRHDRHHSRAAPGSTGDDGAQSHGVSDSSAVLQWTEAALGI